MGADGGHSEEGRTRRDHRTARGQVVGTGAGTVGHDEGTQRLPRYVGMAKAAEMLLTSEPISGKEADRYGLANKAYTDEDLLPKTMEMAKKIAKKSPVAVKSALAMLQYSKPSSYYDGVKAESESFGDVFVSEDAKEGIQAFIEKREPKFTGK